MEINKKIKKRRLDLGLTLRDVAAALNVAESTVSRYESNGIQNMGIDKIRALASVLKCSPAFLMGYDVPIEETVITQLSNPDTILFEITPRSLKNSSKITDIIIQTVKKAFQNTNELNITDYLNSDISFGEKSNILNKLIDYVLYDPLTNHIDIVFLSKENDTFERMTDMMICPVKSQELVCIFESLNTLGQNKILENAKDLTYINMYHKGNEIK